MKKRILFMMPILAIIILVSFTFKVKAADIIQQIDLIYCNPAEDSSTSMRFNWHAKTKMCTLEYTTANDPSFTYASKLNVNGELNTVTYVTDPGTFYVFKPEIKGLTPDTNYLYRITSGAKVSDVYKFKTAGFSGSFNFLNFSDVHSTPSETTKITNLDKLVSWAEEKTSSIGGLDFILTTGDNVKYGNDYAHWQEYNRSSTKRNYMIAPINGNHEQKTSKDGNIDVHDWFLNTWNKPQNGISELEGSYWFIYNNVLFIGLDNQSGTNTTSYARWAESVLAQNEGKYQYSVVFKHFPCFKASGSICSYGGYEACKDIWDRYNVDLVLSGDDHVYARSKVLYDSKECKTDKKGTVYVTVPQIPVSTSPLNIVNSSSPYLEKIETSSCVGALYFTVTPEKLTAYTITWGGNIVDTFEIEAKREFSARSDLKSAVEESLSYVQLKDANEGIVYGDSSMTSIVKKVSFYNGETLVATYEPSKTKQTAFSLKNLQSNKLLTLTAKLVYVDDTEANVNFSANTFNYFGRLSNLKAGISNNKITLIWHNELIGDSVNKIRIYRDTTKVGEIDSNLETYQFDKTESDNGARYKLELLSSDGLVIGEYYCYYSAMGDLNYDGIVDSTDCDEVSSYVFGDTLSNEQKGLADINKDGKVNYADITYMWLNYKKGASLENTTVMVTYRALDGSNISTQIIRMGTDALEPAGPVVDGYTFVGWTVANTSISSDVTIYPIYSK